MVCCIPCDQLNSKRLMVFAHTDEIGFIVHKVESDGFIRITRVGGVSVNVLPGCTVDIIADSGVVRGVIGIKSHHVTAPSEKGKLPPLGDLYIDAGFSSSEQA